MKTLVAIVALSLTSLTVSAQKKLVAKIYPNAVSVNITEQELILTRNSGYSTANAEVYLVKDAKSKVVAYYHKKAKKVMPCENGDQYLEMQMQQTVDNTTLSAGVVVSSNPYKKTAQEDIGGFNELRALVKANLHTQAEFDKVYERYKYLNRAFFNTTNQQDETYGGFLNVQEQLYKEYTEKAQPREASQGELETLMTNIEQLTDQGKYDEAHILVGQLKERMQPAAEQLTDSWATWLEYLSVVEKHAYQSMVIIHKPFAQWHLENDLTVLQTK